MSKSILFLQELTNIMNRAIKIMIDLAPTKRSSKYLSRSSMMSLTQADSTLPSLVSFLPYLWQPSLPYSIHQRYNLASLYLL